jgi:hypothetical protein
LLTIIVATGVCFALASVGCSGPAFESSDEVFELQTTNAGKSGHPSSEDALRCECDYLGTYDSSDYWQCPKLAMDCLEP